METSAVDQAWQLFSALMRNYPLWPSTFSTCDCRRGMGRGGGKCAVCLEEDLAHKVGPIAARRATRAMVEMCEAWEEVRDSAEQRANAKVSGAGTAPLDCRVSANPTTENEMELTFEDALRIARGCTDYGGGYGSNAEHFEIYQHGIQTVINALTAASKTGLDDMQTRVLHSIGANVQGQGEDTSAACGRSPAPGG